MDPNTIDRVSIYPPLGLARVGNAPGEGAWFFASEVRGGAPELVDRGAGPGRDAEGRIMRQAVRFRIYAHLKDGGLVELTHGNGVRITWRVNVANLKAGWYEFNQAMDLPVNLVRSAKRRNGKVTHLRERLDIVPSERSISGSDQRGPAFDDGAFFGKPVYLGELRTDGEGRLIVLGGFGDSESRTSTPPTTFANNEDWHDDVADGPVRASVAIGDATFEAEDAYVVVAPPNYGPGLFGVVTMEDTARQAWTDAGWLLAPTDTSFTEDIWPIFERMSMGAWVNHGHFVVLGTGSPLDPGDPAVVDRMRDASAAGAPWRERVLQLFLPPTQVAFDPGRLPQVFGDAYGETRDAFARERLSVTPIMYAHLQRWAAGAFTDDWPGAPPKLPCFGELSPADQVHHLERAPLYECLGGPFHPGIEMTWNLRHTGQWKRPYRLAVLPGVEPARQDFGELLTRAECLGSGGPLDGVAAGGLTRWLGVPWQTDEASCNSEADYAPSLYLSMPSFWGPRAPEQVLSEEAWSRVVDDAAPDLQRVKHFNYREDWLRDIRGRNYLERIATMITRWWQLGVVVPAESGSVMPDGTAATAWAETGRPPTVSGSNAKLGLAAAIDHLDAPASGIAKAGAAPSKPHRPPRDQYGRGEV